ncbi:MAG: radical SAM protein, partial [Hominenteromicrobium sp.]
MELYHASTYAEQVLRAKADQNHIPLGGSLELLPLCNMDCKMCYVRKTKAEMDAEGRLLTCDEWLKIADEAVQEGLLFLLLTGGEPLLYPEFPRLYAALAQKGIILSVNTNGTLIDEAYAELFSQYGCRRLNITLYGKDDATYAELCRNPKGFTQVMR